MVLLAYLDIVVRLEGGLLVLVHAANDGCGEAVGPPGEGQDMARDGAAELLGHVALRVDARKGPGESRVAAWA